jgi:hypothetical protein
VDEDEDEDEDEGDGPPQLVSGEYADEDGFMDSAAAMVLERMARERKGAEAGLGPPVICSAHVQGPGLGRGY